MIKKLANVITDAFLQDPLYVYLLKGIKNKEEVLQKQAEVMLEFAKKKDIIFTLENNYDAVMLATYSFQHKKSDDIIYLYNVIKVSFKMMNIWDFLILLKNHKKTSKVLNFKWYKEFTDGHYYHLKLIAIDKKLKGTGAFRKLITPVLENAKKQKIPVVLETLNPDNIQIYEHFGFKLVKTFTAQNIDLVQYCMIKYHK